MDGCLIRTMGVQVSNGGLTTFNTLIIQGLGCDAKTMSLLAMPPGFMSTASWILLSYIAATKRNWRTVVVAVTIPLPLMGDVICYALPRTNLASQLVGLFTLYTYWAPHVKLVSIYQANTSGHTKKVRLYAWDYFAWAIGNITGPKTFRADQAPMYTGGTVAITVCYYVAIRCILTYGAISWRNNERRRAEMSEKSGETDWLDWTDKENVAFRYTT